MNCHKAIIIAFILVSVDFYLVGCASNPEPAPFDKKTFESIIVNWLKNHSTTETTTPPKISTIPISEKPSTITTTIRSTTLETGIIEEPPMEQKGSDYQTNDEDPIPLALGWLDREITVNEKMVLITIAVVAMEVMIYRMFERAFHKLNNPVNSILDEAFVV